MSASSAALEWNKIRLPSGDQDVGVAIDEALFGECDLPLVGAVGVDGENRAPVSVLIQESPEGDPPVLVRKRRLSGNGG